MPRIGASAALATVSTGQAGWTWTSSVAVDKRFASTPLVAVHVNRLRPKIEALGYRIESDHRPASGGWRMVRAS